MKIALSIAFIGLFALGAAHGTSVECYECGGVIITEIMWNPTKAQGRDSRGEWVEILNLSCDPVDLSGWEIADNFHTDSLVIGDGGSDMMLSAGQYAVIIDGMMGSSVPALYTIPTNARIFKTDDVTLGNGLSNGGDQFKLLDSTGAAIDMISYANTEPANTGSNNGGKTLERTNPFDSTSFVTSASVGGTIGALNEAWVVPPTDPCVCSEVVEQVGLLLSDWSTFFLCDGGISFWEGITESGRTMCEAQTPAGTFTQIHLIADNLVTAAGVDQCIVDLGEPQAISPIAPVTTALLLSSNFYVSFGNSWNVAISVGQVQEPANFAAADVILRRLFTFLETNCSQDIIVFQNDVIDGQSDFLYIFDKTAPGTLSNLFFGCG